MWYVFQGAVVVAMLLLLEAAIIADNKVDEPGVVGAAGIVAIGTAWLATYLLSWVIGLFRKPTFKREKAAHLGGGVGCGGVELGDSREFINTVGPSEHLSEIPHVPPVSDVGDKIT